MDSINEYRYDFSPAELQPEPDPETECRDCGGRLDENEYCEECRKNYG